MKELRSLQSLPLDAVYDEMNSPVGKLTLVVSSNGLHAVLWETTRENQQCKQIIKTLNQSKQHKIIMQTQQQLTEYFQGKRNKFDLPLVLRGTDFQIQVWEQLRKIPFATTISYGEQAARIGDKNKARAVGMANGLNPISIIVPCHRVIGSNGRLVGFGGGIENKAYLLKLEQNANR